MSLDDFGLLDGAEERQALLAQLRAFNASTASCPAETVHALFTAQARRAPHACAARQHDREVTYGELECESNRVANLLAAHGVGHGDMVGVLLDDAVPLVTALLGVLKAGAAYVPLDTDAPYDRLRYVLDDTCAKALVTARTHIRRANRLQWDCAALDVLLCVDSDAVHEEPEELGEKMRREVWDHVGQTMFDDISGGGWQSSFTGEWLSREVMDDYGDNIRRKLAPLLSASSRVLEIGCSSGISLFRLAPLVGEYVGTDLSPEILARTRQEVERRGLTNVRLDARAAHEIEGLPDRGFDVVVINSVLQCFSGHNYLRDVIRKAVGLMADRGVLFLGNVFDQDLKDAFLAELRDYAAAHRAEGVRTKTDYSEELFINRAYIDDLRFDVPGVADADYSPLLGTHESELSRFSFDAIVRIDKAAGQVPPGPRHKHQLDRGHLAHAADTPVDAPATNRSLAYCIYTSGTSGRPKGVLVEHRSIVRLVTHPDYVTLGPDTRVLMSGAFAFDASTFEIWAPLLNGGTFHRAPKTVVLDPRELSAAIARWRINTMWLTAGLFNQLVDEDTRLFAPLTQLLIGGEKLSAPHVRAVRQAHPHLQVINGYGPTENTTFTTCCRIDRDYPGDIPIGRPINGTQVLIVDEGGEYVPVGIPGEICAAGDGLARGYLNDADLTARKFAPHPEDPGQRMYRTGDRGRWTADGQVEYLGRIDDQVKIRGYRIEPGEIEFAIRGLVPGSDVVVVATEPSGPGETRELAAYVTGSVDVAALRAALKECLPDYMVPAHLVAMERLPLTPNGKVDRRALPPPTPSGPGGAIVRPATETERELAAIWRDVLGAPDLSVTDNFFDLGGHSLKITRLVSRIQERLGVRVPLAAVFKAPTVRDLAQYLLDAAHYGIDLADERLVVLGGAADVPPVFALPPGTGDVFGYMPLAALLPEVRFHAFNFIEGESRLDEYASLIAAAAPEPYTLFGYSSGGNLAYHVAATLEARGRRVGQVVMVDSGRTVSPYPYDEAAVQEAVGDFLGHESVKPYVSTPVLRDKVLRKVLALYRFLSSTTDTHVLDADIHVLLCENPRLEGFREGRLVTSVPGWKDATRGVFRTWQGAGDHNHMLLEPALTKNAEILRALLK